MFIRPIGSVVNPAQRPPGHPLLRGILARGAYVWDAAHHPAAAPPSQRPDGTAAAPAPAPSAGRAPQPEPGVPGAVSPGADLTDRLTQLAALAREGLLTPEEFSAAKARLLAG